MSAYIWCNFTKREKIDPIRLYKALYDAKVHPDCYEKFSESCGGDSTDALRYLLASGVADTKEIVYRDIKSFSNLIGSWVGDDVRFLSDDSYLVVPDQYMLFLYAQLNPDDLQPHLANIHLVVKKAFKDISPEVAQLLKEDRFYWSKKAAEQKIWEAEMAAKRAKG